MHVGVERLEVDPEAIISRLIIVPLLPISHYAFKRDMPGNRERLGYGKTRFNLFESNVRGRFLPTVEAVMKPEV
jgi:hypothetical protein